MVKLARGILGLDVLALGLICVVAGTAWAGAGWRELETGLEVAHFNSRTQDFAAAGDLTVVRIEPHLFELKLLRSAADERDLAQWCRDFDLVAATNAGMYQVDRRTHVGFCKVDGQVVNGFANDYLSAAAFGPVDPSDPPFKIFDLDETPLREILPRYRNVVQNLRLIKRARENRWQPAADQWPEAALAEDSQGRVLLVYCRTPWPMYELNHILLELPLEVVAAQHLEGHSPARLRLNHPAYESGPEGEAPGPMVPNVLGVVRRLSEQ